MKTLPLVLLALSLPAFAQKMQTPAGEAPGPWILGTIGVGKGDDPKIPKTTALKGIAIKIGEHGEAAVAYDLDLCRMVGAWTGKFTTPMNLMSRGEYPTAMGEVAFTTAERAGFELKGAIPAEDRSLPTVNQNVSSQTRNVPSPNQNAPSPNQTVPSPNQNAPSPNQTVPSPNQTVPSPNQNVPSANQNLPSPNQNAPSPAQNLPNETKSLPNPTQSLSERPENLPWRDPRPEPFGPLPPGQARFKGFYVNGDKTILKWDIGGVEVLETPGHSHEKGADVFTRNLHFGTTSAPILVSVSEAPGKLSDLVTEDQAEWEAEGRRFQVLWRADDIVCLWKIVAGNLCLEIPALSKAATVSINLAVSPKTGSTLNHDNFYSVSAELRPKAALDASLHGGPGRSGFSLTMQSEVSKDIESAYVVDTIKLPDPNPWYAPMFIGGFDFFERGTGNAERGTEEPPGSALRVPHSAYPWDAAVCTFHGDVFLVSGLDEKLEKVTWKRFASGLYHPLGLKIVNGEIYVTCRDGLWRLKDLNGDGEADFYEAFNFDVKVTKSFHEFVFDLQTDPAGNFYFAKAGPVKNGGRGFDEIMEHHGTLMRVSPDGAKLEVVATGFRAPNGIGVGPHGELTSGDNEGTWTPACKINWIKPGGFYGVVPLSHRDPLPSDYDRPLCWLPKRVDNSGGGQVWAPDGERWGPWGGRMLHLSYGQSSLYGVLWEKVGSGKAEVGSAEATAVRDRSDFRLPTSDFVQGGVTKFPLQFQSGIMRGRFNPRDGQLYVVGLRGWQTNGLKNGCLQRVRYTGAEARMPIEMHVKKDGIELRFTASLDTQSAREPENWHIEQWRYLWSAAYGSPELSAATDPEAPAEAGKDGDAQFTKAQMSKNQHDPVTVKSVTIGTDDRTVFLEIPGLKPVMQMSIKYDLKTDDGKDLRGEIVNTIHALGGE